MSEAKVKGSGNDLSLDLKYAGTKPGAYPALLVTYEIACSKGLAADKTAIVKDFLTYFSSSNAQSKLEDLGYAPLPSDLQSKSRLLSPRSSSRLPQRRVIAATHPR